MAAPSDQVPWQKTARHLGETLVVAAIGGLTFGLAGLPAGFLSGAILAVAICALSGRTMVMPGPLLKFLLISLGISLGSMVTPETLRGLATYPSSIVALLIAMTITGSAGSFYLRRMHGMDPITSYLAAAPGGLSQVMAVGFEVKADIRAIVIVQTLRVAIIAIGLPSLLAGLGFAGVAVRPDSGPLSLAQLPEFAILIAASAAMAFLALWLRFPGGMLFGSMITSAVLHGTGIIHVVMPVWFVNVVQIMFGATTGSRFSNTSLRMVADFFTAAIGAFVTSVAITALCAAVLLHYFDFPVAEVVIAYAPGAVDAMMLMALALHLDPVYVGAHHLARIFWVSVTLPLVARRMAKSNPTINDGE